MKDFLSYFKKYNLTPRTIQIEVLEKLNQNWDKYDYFVLSCPVGVGKSHIGLAIADCTKNAYILTSTLQLQEQYEKTNEAVVSIKGRSNYICAINSEFTVDVAPCIAHPQQLKDCLTKKVCPYYNQREKAINSKMLITNYAFFMTAAQMGKAREDNLWIEREILIMDEAHNVEGQLINMAQITLDIAELGKKHGLKVSHMSFTKDYDLNMILVGEIMDILREKITDLEERISDEYKSKRGFSGKSFAAAFDNKSADKIKNLIKAKSNYQNLLGPLDLFSETNLPGNWIIHPDDYENTLILTPLKANFLYQRFLGDMAKKHIFVSATIGDPDVFMTELGLDKDKVLFLETGTPFPKELSPIVLLPTLRMSHKDIDDTLKTINTVIEPILDQHPDESGIIHSGTYKIQGEIFKRLSKPYKDRIICREMYGPQIKVSNAEMLDLHRSGKIKNSILMSPSLIEGTDLYDELSRFQLILKMPWGSLGDIRVKTKSTLDNGWYANDMWNKILQASGRSTRHEKDYSVTYCLDSSYWFWYNKWKSHLPTWFNERIVKI